MFLIYFNPPTGEESEATTRSHYGSLRSYSHPLAASLLCKTYTYLLIFLLGGQIFDSRNANYSQLASPWRRQASHVGCQHTCNCVLAGAFNHGRWWEQDALTGVRHQSGVIVYVGTGSLNGCRRTESPAQPRTCLRWLRVAAWAQRSSHFRPESFCQSHWSICCRVASSAVQQRRPAAFQSHGKPVHLGEDKQSLN